jgi:hypothetical protein
VLDLELVVCARIVSLEQGGFEIHPSTARPQRFGPRALAHLEGTEAEVVARRLLEMLGDAAGVM